MVIENISNIILPDSLVKDLSFLATLFQAVGGLIIVYIVFNIINLKFVKKRQKELEKIRSLLETINKKIKK
jgi:uncharacterized membrane protein YqgA involved in biofilm formation